MGFFRASNLDWVKALIKEGISDKKESQLLLRWVASPPDANLNRAALQVLRRIIERTERYFSLGGGDRKMNNKAKESSKIAKIIIKRITKK